MGATILGFSDYVEKKVVLYLPNPTLGLGPFIH